MGKNSRTPMPKNKRKERGAQRRRGWRDAAGSEDTTRDVENEKLLAEAETAALENPYFSYDRCPRYVRQHKVAGDRNRDYIQRRLKEAAGGKEGDKLGKSAWRKLAKEEIAIWEAERKEQDEHPESMWYVTAQAKEIRTLPKDEARRDGYVHALLIIKGKQAITVGQSIPLKGETTAHYTCFLSEYDEPHFARGVDPVEGAGHEGEDGVFGVRTVNDVCAILVYELAKVALKRLKACALLDRALAGHLQLHAEASEKLDEMRLAFIQMEPHPHTYKLALEVLSQRLPGIVKNALEAQRSGALNMEEYWRSTAEFTESLEKQEAAIAGCPPCAQDHPNATIDGLTDHEVELGIVILDGVRVEPEGVGRDLVNAMTLSLGPHNIDVEAIDQSFRDEAQRRRAKAKARKKDITRKLTGTEQHITHVDDKQQAQQPVLDVQAATDPLHDPVPELEPELVPDHEPPESHNSDALLERPDQARLTNESATQESALVAHGDSDAPRPDSVPEGAPQMSEEQIEMELKQWFEQKEGIKARTTRSQRIKPKAVRETPYAKEQRLILEAHLSVGLGLDPDVAKERALALSLGRRGVTVENQKFYRPGA